MSEQNDTPKDEARAVLDRLPDDCTLDDVIYHLYVLQEIKQGRADRDAGRVRSHEDVASTLRKKWTLGNAG